MTPTQYLADSKRTTASTELPEQRLKEMLGLDIALSSSLRVIVNEADELDKLKKIIFYGKGELLDTDYETNDFASSTLINEKFVDTLHGIIGIATEAGELCEALLKPITSIDGEGNPVNIDVVNIEEELSDILWYAALLCRTHGFTFEKIMDKNIAKLKARYPEKFSEADAVNRNLKKERKILESDNPSSEISK
jgi:NTP pyrophosphatase (non-canonical NTP hydrolase)